MAVARATASTGATTVPLHAPEGSYASDAGDGATRIREFRAMVQALHGVGLRVGMDVVYNHTTASGQSPRSVLDRIVPGYYQRLDAEGKVERSTCCDNTATEHMMMARLMRDSVALWARHYRIDSFRFDLMGHQPRAAMLDVQRAANAAAGRNVPLLGEGWNFGEVADGARFEQAAQSRLDGTAIATFSDRARDALRGGGAATVARISSLSRACSTVSCMHPTHARKARRRGANCCMRRRPGARRPRRHTSEAIGCRWRMAAWSRCRR